MVHGASLGAPLGCTLLLALLVGLSGVSISSSSMDLGGPLPGFYPRFNPFFFLCTHHGELEGAGLAEGGVEVLLTFQVTGSPTAYTPGQEYQGERRPSTRASDPRIHPPRCYQGNVSCPVISISICFFPASMVNNYEENGTVCLCRV